MKTTRNILAFVTLIAAVGLTDGAAKAGLVGQLGVLDVTNANGGINPATSNPWQAGDTYHLAFVSNGTRDATDPDIATYHAFVQAQAAAAGMGGTTWYSILQTWSDPVRDTNAPPMTTSYGIFLVNSDKLADNGADLANGPDVTFSQTEINTYYDGRVASGSNRKPGDPTPGQTKIEHGVSWATDGRWWQQYNGLQTDQWHFYAISDPLTVQQVGPPTVQPTLALGSRVLVSENNANFNISVFDGKAGYDNTGTGQPLVQTPFGDGTVEDYNFIVSRNGQTDPLSYANGGAGLTPDPYDPNPGTGGWSNNNGQNWANVWTTSDPDVDPKDFISGSINTTHAGHGEVQGTVDISGLVSGTLYFPHGTYINQWSLTLTMTGPGQLTLIASDAQTSNGPGTNYGWITDFSFANPDLAYDTITYTYLNADLDGSRARFMGVILDGQAAGEVPEPATMALLGLAAAGLGGYVRRRRNP